MSETRVSLYDRLPEIYRIRDEEQQPPGQLKQYLALVEVVYGAIHDNIEALYHDLFIETCEDWVIPYIGDLLGTSHLKGDAWTLRADVADTIALRRRKGTLGAIEQLTYDLTRWGVHCVELLENLVWNHHLNHQRPDRGGNPPYAKATRHTVIRGGTIVLRDAAMLSLLNSPFDPFAHVVDLKPPAGGNIRYNLPNLAIFLWRLVAYRIDVSQPVSRGIQPIDLTKFPDAAPFVVRFDVHPLGQPVRLFNINRHNPNLRPPVVSLIDETPSPIPTPRLTSQSNAGVPDKYVTVETYNPIDLAANAIDIGETGLQLHIPGPTFSITGWTFRGANLCAWEAGLNRALHDREIAIDPVIGRIAIGVKDDAEATALVNQLLLTYTYGAVGPVGAHPISRSPAPTVWQSRPGEAPQDVIPRTVDFHQDSNGLQAALQDIGSLTAPLMIEIKDSMTHTLDISTIQLNRSLIIRAASDQRPVIKLVKPLRFRPQKVKGVDANEQDNLNALMSLLTVRLEGLYLTRGDSWVASDALIEQAAVNQLEILDCTLDPGGNKELDGTAQGKRKDIFTSLKLDQSYGFSDDIEKAAFNQVPEIILHRTIAGPILIDTNYKLHLTESIIDAGKGIGDDSSNSFAVTSTTDPGNTWGAPTQVHSITVFGRMRVESISGQGGIWVHPLEVLNNQKGCLKFSYFSGQGDRLPQNHACVSGTEAKLRFVSEIFGQPAYGQIHESTDSQIREQGPNDDAMGAFGFLLESHKWRNLQIRYREFMPVGIRPLLIPVT
ncbi:MAG: hypothetical protein KME60_27745 [Cyanomargarita calcarea GSE-NOS-MK-12-04C]|jgi:hypothetical protein|uniref:Phage tail protein (Tail_P2_I) n=1 Tax=Cyanomargarita calcarea GSE-NOS-MK-12-04C TaxID=2839659 RepID=A0A951UVH4_9CYAN|nr:hypothetical protein [Cyanomargarita calcarea GSE-NOS-MK-12-04C]